jgi:hypothetical protein
MPVIAEAVARRFLAFSVMSDERFRPPKEVVNAVDSGELPAEALNVWKAVVEGQSGGARALNYGAAYAYWRNKCLKNGIALPPSLQKGGQGATHGPWKIKTGDEIEEWVKQTLKSKGLLDDVAKTAHDWEMEIVHLERMLQETEAKIDGRLRGSGPGARTPLEKSKAELAKYAKQLDEAKAELDRLQKETSRYAKAQNCAIEFEKEFQFMMLVAAKDLDKKAVLESVKKAIERFEQGLDIPGAESPAHDIEKYKNAGILDAIGGALSKAWNWLASTFDSLIDWFKDLGQDTDKISSMLDQAGA